nr:hypothetical protein [Tanacetum cinerariifolium]
MVLMESVIIKCHSSYNIIIGRTGMRSLRAVGSTIYSMIKFPTKQGVATIETSREALRECKHLERVQGHVSLSRGKRRAKILNGIPVQMFPPTSKRIQPNKNGGRGRRKDWVSYRGRKREGIRIPISYVSRLLQGMEICYTPTEKMVQTLIHMARSLRGIFRKHKVKVVTDGPMEEILKLLGGGWLAKWATKIREQVERTPDANEEGTLTLSKELQAKSTPTPKAWWLYLGKETIKEGLGVGVILVSPEENVHPYATRLKFKASNHVMDYEELLAGLAASANQGIKDFHFYIDSLTLVAQVEGNRTPATEHERKYKE